MFHPAGGGMFYNAPDCAPYIACNRCGGVDAAVRVGSRCTYQVEEIIGTYAGGFTRKVQCDGTVIDVGAAIAAIVPTYDPAWWIVTTGDNVIRHRWEMPLP